jgi:hypothetical protein
MILESFFILGFNQSPLQFKQNQMKYLNIFFKIPTVIMIGVSPGDV